MPHVNSKYIINVSIYIFTYEYVSMKSQVFSQMSPLHKCSIFIQLLKNWKKISQFVATTSGAQPFDRARQRGDTFFTPHYLQDANGLLSMSTAFVKYIHIYTHNTFMLFVNMFVCMPFSLISIIYGFPNEFLSKSNNFQALEKFYGHTNTCAYLLTRLYCIAQMYRYFKKKENKK